VNKGVSGRNALGLVEEFDEAHQKSHHYPLYLTMGLSVPRGNKTIAPTPKKKATLMGGLFDERIKD
jgi:hypothetical protein